MSFGPACKIEVTTSGGSHESDTTPGTTEGDSDGGTDASTGATGHTGDPTTGDPTTGAGADDPVWMTPYCYQVADAKWLAAWREREQKMLQLVNQARAKGANCGSAGSFGPAGPLVMNPSLHCAARKHSQDMAERNFFNHVNPDGEDPFDRMEKAGYDYFAAGENIAAGDDDPEVTLAGWLESDGHCANIMDPKYTEFGVGFYEGPGTYIYYWTQTFGTPLK